MYVYIFTYIETYILSVSYIKYTHLYSDGKQSACNAEDQGLIPGSGRSPEKEMATHSSILAWKIPWTEEPGGLQSMELQRLAYD